MHSTHDPDEVQVDPRALSDVTDEEEVQVCVNFRKMVCVVSVQQTSYFLMR